MERLPVLCLVVSLLAVPAGGAWAPSGQGSSPDPGRTAWDSERWWGDLPGLVGRVPGDEDASAGSPLRPETGIGPGSYLRIRMPDGSPRGCTANFVFATPDGDRYLGTAGHCVLPDDEWGTHGPWAGFNASGVRIRTPARGCHLSPNVVGPPECTLRDGPAWLRLGEVTYATDWDDLALVRVPSALHDQLRLTMPNRGGPTGVGDASPGQTILYYGHGFDAAPPTRARSGTVLTVTDETWAAVGPSNGGDSGGPVVVARDGELPHEGGAALGWMASGVVAGVSGRRIGPAQANVLCWANLSIRLLPGGDQLDGCPRPDVGTQGVLGTVIVDDLVGDVDEPWMDVDRVWIGSDGSSVRFAFGVRDLDPSRARHEVSIYHKADWYAFCKLGRVAGAVDEAPRCSAEFGDRGSYETRGRLNRTADVVSFEVPYDAMGWESGDVVGEVAGETEGPCVGTSDLIPDRTLVLYCRNRDDFEGTGQHTLS